MYLSDTCIFIVCFFEYDINEHIYLGVAAYVAS
jgi:hypothetical protein